MTAAEGYLAVGGQRSQVVVSALGSDWRASTSIGGAINNCVHIASHAGLSAPRLFVCNNDETCKIFQLPTMEHVATIRLPTAVNGVSVSPDGQHMLVVGDTNQVFLYAVGRAGSGADRVYERVATLTSGRDAGFSCAWDQTSQRFAVGCQDACVCVWDVRMISTASVPDRRPDACVLPAAAESQSPRLSSVHSLSPPLSSVYPSPPMIASFHVGSPSFPALRNAAQPAFVPRTLWDTTFAQGHAQAAYPHSPSSPALTMSPPQSSSGATRKLAHIASTQGSGRGAVRAVKFAHGGSVDLLAFSEHTSYVNVVDARTFATRESVRVRSADAPAQPGAPGDVNITGLAFAADSSSVLVGTEHAILEYGLDTRRRRTFGAGQVV